jgi:hypothetical protein
MHGTWIVRAATEEGPAVSKETPKNDPRQATDWKNTKQTDAPWNGPVEKEQKPGGPKALRNANDEGCGGRGRATAAALPAMRRDRSADHADGHRLAAGRAEATKVTKSGEGELLTSRRAIHIQPLAGLARRRHRGGQAHQATP